MSNKNGVLEKTEDVSAKIVIKTEFRLYQFSWLLPTDNREYTLEHIFMVFVDKLFQPM